MSIARAVVVGGSIAGLLTAAALSESVGEVVVVERDELPDGPEHRRGVPQGNQVHALLAAGQSAMETLLPGIVGDFRAAGGRVVDSPAELAVLGRQGWAGRVPSSAHVVCMRRPALEHVVRNRVRALPGVRLVRDCVTGLLATEDRSRVTGVVLLEGDPRSLEADLVIDASGRGSRAVDWLTELGYEGPRVQELRSFIAYATVLVRLPAGALPDGLAGILAPPNPDNVSGAAIVPCDSGLHLLAALGMMRTEPPRDWDALLAHVDRAPSPLVGQVARRAEVLGDVSTYKMPGTRRRRWEDLPRRPEGFALVGDAVMSVNPIYGQGMSVAAVEAVVVRDAVAAAGGQITGLAEALQRAVVPTISTVFDGIVSVDSQYDGSELDGVQAPAPDAVAFGRAASQLATEDAETALALKHYAHWFDSASLRTESVERKVAHWISEGRTVRHDDPLIVPGLLRSG